MRVLHGARRLTIACALAALCTPAFAQFDLQITEIWMGNEPGNNLTEDWFEITNIGLDPWSPADGDLYYDDDSKDETTADLISGITGIAPGESVIVVVDDGLSAVTDFVSVWLPVYELSGVQFGQVDGSGLGQGGDGVTLWVGTPLAGNFVDFESYPDADAFGGQSWDVGNQKFSEVGDMPDQPAATNIVNDESQPAIGSPGNQGPVQMVGDAPVITLTGDAEVFLQLSDIYVDDGATASDTEDGNITGQIVVGGDVVDTSVFGEYTITYNVTDSDGNPAVSVTRTVIVTHPETIPAAPAPARPNLFSHVATLGGLPGAEIPAYDKGSKQAYITSGDGVQIVDLSDPANPMMGALIDPAGAPFNLGVSEVTSVDVCNGTVAFAVPADPQTDPGTVVFTESDGTLIRMVTVGALPDMLTFTKRCRTVVTADEGEPDNGIDPPGGVSIINVRTGNVRTADFSAFNGQEDALRSKGVRIFPGVLAGVDFEPEYVALGPLNVLAYVTLQEANALAVVNLLTANVVKILPLGLKDHSLPGNELDASDRDSVINVRNWPLFGMYMPDAIDGYSTRRHPGLYITANEGDARDNDARVASLTLDPTAFPPAEDLQNEFNIGRIQVSDIDGDVDGDGDYDVLQSYGARSFSIWDSFGRQLYDSGNEIEAIVASQTPDSYDDGRSDNKGPEPEGVEIGKISGRSIAFIGLERTDQVLVYDVSNPYQPRFLQLLQNEGDEAPEGLRFLGKSESPNRCPTLLVTNEGSDTLTIYQRRTCAQ